MLIDSTNDPSEPLEKEREQQKLLVETHSTSKAIIILKSLLKRSAPFFAYQVVDISGIFVSTLLFSKLGPQEYDASNYIGQLQNFMLNPVFAFLMGSAIVSSRKLAENGPETVGTVGRVLKMSYLNSLIISIPGVAVSFFCDDILIGLGQDEELAEITQKFFLGYALSLPANYMLRVTQDFLIGIDKSYIALGINFFNNTISILLGYLLMEYFGLGVFGVGLGNVVGSWLALSIFILCSHRMSGLKVFNIFTCNRFLDGTVFKDLIKVGLPRGVFVGIDTLSSTISLLMVGKRWNEDLGALVPGNTWYGLLSTPLNTLDIVSGVLVGDAIGNRSYAQAKKIGNISILLSVCIATLIFACSAILNRFLIETFLSNNALFNLTQSMFILTLAKLIPNSLRLVSEGALSGSYDTQFAMWVDLVTSTFVPLASTAIYVYLVSDSTVVYPAVTQLISLLLGAGLLFWRWKNKTPSELSISDDGCSVKKLCLEWCSFHRKPKTSDLLSHELENIDEQLMVLPGYV